MLLKRGKISPELRITVISTLKTDEEKEEFFREYEMNDELCSFLIERNRYSEACALAIATADLDKAWHLSESSGGMETLPLKDRIETYNYRQVKLLHNNLSSDPGKLFVKDPAWAPQCRWLPDRPSIITFWLHLPHQLHALLGHEITYESLVFNEMWMRQLFDLIVQTLGSHLTYHD